MNVVWMLWVYLSHNTAFEDCPSSALYRRSSGLHKQPAGGGRESCATYELSASSSLMPRKNCPVYTDTHTHKHRHAHTQTRTYRLKVRFYYLLVNICPVISFRTEQSSFNKISNKYRLRKCNTTKMHSLSETDDWPNHRDKSFPAGKDHFPNNRSYIWVH